MKTRVCISRIHVNAGWEFTCNPSTWKAETDTYSKLAREINCIVEIQYSSTKCSTERLCLSEQDEEELGKIPDVSLYMHVFMCVHTHMHVPPHMPTHVHMRKKLSHKNKPCFRATDVWLHGRTRAWSLRLFLAPPMNLSINQSLNQLNLLFPLWDRELVIYPNLSFIQTAGMRQSPVGCESIVILTTVPVREVSEAIR